jgi:hypothetical protein
MDQLIDLLIFFEKKFLILWVLGCILVSFVFWVFLVLLPSLLIKLLDMAQPRRVSSRSQNSAEYRYQGRRRFPFSRFFSRFSRSRW